MHKRKNNEPRPKCIGSCKKKSVYQYACAFTVTGMNVYNRALKSGIEVMRDQQSEGFVEDFKIADGTFKNLNKEKRLVLALSEQNEKFKIVIATSFVPVILIFRRTLW